MQCVFFSHVITFITFSFPTSDVCTKYQEASKIVNLALEGLVTQCVPGAKVLDLCEFGTKVMEAAAAKLYTKKVNGKTVDRGIAFPVCISVNNMVCNFSPLQDDETVSRFSNDAAAAAAENTSKTTCPGPLYKWVTSLPATPMRVLPLAQFCHMGNGVPRLIRRPFDDRKRKEEERTRPSGLHLFLTNLTGPGRITPYRSRSWCTWMSFGFWRCMASDALSVHCMCIPGVSESRTLYTMRPSVCMVA
jgi:hypothetical protein